MAKQITCECGEVLRGESEGEVVARTRAHIRSDHPELDDKVSDDVLSSWIEEV